MRSLSSEKEDDKLKIFVDQVMAPKTIMRGAKRLLEECDDGNRDNEQKIQQISYAEDFVTRRTTCNRVDQIISCRWKRVSHPETAEASESNSQDIIAAPNENAHMITEERK